MYKKRYSKCRTLPFFVDFHKAYIAILGTDFMNDEFCDIIPDNVVQFYHYRSAWQYGSGRVSETDKPVYRLQKLALVRAYFAGLHFARQLRVLVDQPSLAQHVRRRVL